MKKSAIPTEVGHQRHCHKIHMIRLANNCCRQRHDFLAALPWKKKKREGDIVKRSEMGIWTHDQRHDSIPNCTSSHYATKTARQWRLKSIKIYGDGPPYRSHCFTMHRLLPQLHRYYDWPRHCHIITTVTGPVTEVTITLCWRAPSL